MLVKQCILESVDHPGFETIAWIDATAAKTGFIVELLPEKLKYKVLQAFGQEIEDVKLNDISRRARASLTSIIK